MRVKRLPREVREQQILSAAVEVFSRRGYHSASMDEISEAAGISKPMIYTYLGSKEDLFSVCLRQESTRLLEAITSGILPDLPADVALWHGVRSFFDFVGANRNSWQVLHQQVSAQGGPFTTEFAETRARAISLVAALLIDTSSTARNKELGATVNESGEALAAALVGAGESLADWWLDHPEESASAMAARLMNLAWMGFGDLFEGRVWRPPT